jgi:transposase
MPGQAVRTCRAHLAMMLDGAFSSRIASRTALSKIARKIPVKGEGPVWKHGSEITIRE